MFKQVILSRNAAGRDDPADVNINVARTFNSSISTAIGYSSPSASWPSIVSIYYATSGDLVVVRR